MAGSWKLRGYVVESLLGRGASSEVWRARVAASGDPVALKRLFLTSPAQCTRAHAEAALLTVLDHPNLVRLHDLVPSDEAAVLVLDLADGGSLADLLATRGRLTPGEVITAIAPAAAALAYVHRSGVVHGDVTPANILFTRGGVALLADLGVARLTGDDRDAESTPAYVDPAVAQGSVPAAASDVFMLGAVALHALTGAPVWSADDADAVLRAARAGEVDDLARRLAEAAVPVAMAAVIARALQIDPSRRGTAADLALDLRHSGTPIAVELDAGRARPDPAQWPSASRPIEVVGYGQTTPRQALAAAARARPSGAVAVRSASRPAHAARHAAPVGAPPPTVAVRRPRPTIPQRRRRRPGRPRVAFAVAALGVAALLGAVTMLWAPWRGIGAEAAQKVSTRSAARHAAAPAVKDWGAVLRGLDALRADAFATRDAALLRQVYVPGPLLEADIATLRRTVPPGCTLLGVVTRFDRLKVIRTGSDGEISARARLPPATLHCPDRVSEQTIGVPATSLRIVLRQTSDGPRIAQERAEEG
ncbi:MAG: serine/threonine-protein kinase [Jatrophihabitans sp.]